MGMGDSHLEGQLRKPRIARGQNAIFRGAGVESTGLCPDPPQSGCYVGRAVLQKKWDRDPPDTVAKWQRRSVFDPKRLGDNALRAEASLPRGSNERGKDAVH